MTYFKNHVGINPSNNIFVAYTIYYKRMYNTNSFIITRAKTVFVSSIRNYVLTSLLNCVYRDTKTFKWIQSQK